MTVKTDPVVEIQNENLKDVIEPEVIQPIEEALIIEESPKVEEQFKSEDEDREDFVKTVKAGAAAAGLLQLRGHKSVGGMRASLYNAMPLAGVQALVAYMHDFERRHG